MAKEDDFSFVFDDDEDDTEEDEEEYDGIEFEDSSESDEEEDGFTFDDSEPDGDEDEEEDEEGDGFIFEDSDSDDSEDSDDNGDGFIFEDSDSGEDDEIDLEEYTKNLNAEFNKSTEEDDELPSFGEPVSDFGMAVNKTRQKRSMDNDKIFLNGTSKGEQTQNMYNSIVGVINKLFGKGK